MDIWRLTTLSGAIFIVSVLVINTTWSKVSKLVCLLFSFYCVWVMFYLPIGPLYPEQVAKMWGGGRALLSVLFLPLAMGLLSEKSSRMLRHLLFAFYLLNSILRVRGYSLWQGTTQDTLILMVFLPYFHHWYRRLSLLALSPIVFDFLVTIEILPKFWDVLHDVGNGTIVVGAVYLFWYLIEKKNGPAVVYSSALTASFVVFKWNSFDPITQRVEVWQEFTDHWLKYASPLVGFGPGSFEWITLRPTFNYHWTWAHGDWYQIGWETGVVGLFVAFLYYLFLVRKVDSEYKRVTLVGLGVAMLVYSPLQYMWTQMLLLLMVKERSK